MKYLGFNVVNLYRQTPSQEQLDAFRAALDYLKPSLRAQRLLQNLIDNNVTIQFVDYFYNPKIYGDMYNSTYGNPAFPPNTIFWDPFKAMVVTNQDTPNVDKGTEQDLGLQSAAIGLIHEAAHALDVLSGYSFTDAVRQADPNKTWVGAYDYPEEVYAVAQEDLVAKVLNDVQRFNHRGSDVQVANATLHTVTIGNEIKYQEQFLEGRLTVTAGSFQQAPYGTYKNAAFDELATAKNAQQITITNSNSDVSIAEKATLTINEGSNDSFTLGAGSSLNEHGSNNTFRLQNNSSLDAYGSNDTFYLGDGSRVVVHKGTNNDQGSNENFIITPPATGSSNVTIDDKAGDGSGSIQVGGSALTGPGSVQATQNGKDFVWVVNPSLTYMYTPASAKGDVGTLQISTPGELITIDNFNFNQAQTDAGYLGIKIQQKCKVKMGCGALTPAEIAAQAGGPADPPPGAYNFTAYVSAISDQPQTVTLGLSGADPAGFAVDTGNGIIQFVNGQITLTIPAGRDSVTFGLINTTDVPTPETIQLTETLNGNTAVTDTLAVTYTASPAANTTQANYTIAGGYAPREFKTEIPAGTTTIDPTWLNPTYAVGSTHTDPDTGLVTVLSYIVSYNLKDAAGNLIPDMGKPTPNKNADLLGSSGNDEISTIANATYLDARQGGNDTISGDQNNDYILAGDGNNIITGQGGKDILTAGNGNNQIYANDKIDIVTALAQNQTATPTKKTGDYIAVGNGNNTIVGGNGNDAILMGTGDNTVYCGPGSVTLMGGVSAQGLAVFYNKGRFKREAANDAEGRLAA